MAVVRFFWRLHTVCRFTHQTVWKAKIWRDSAGF